MDTIQEAKKAKRKKAECDRSHEADLNVLA